MKDKWLIDQDYCEHIALSDGMRLRIRPIRSSDKVKMAESFKNLSAESRYRRCFSLKRELTSDELAFFCDIDGSNHFALVAVLLNEDGQESDGIGGARFIRMADEACVAEVAFLVVDAWQGRGVGRLLLERLVDAALERGIKRLRCYLLAENSQARHFIRSVSQNVCWDISYHNEGSLIAAEISIEEPELAESLMQDTSVFDLLEFAVAGYSIVPAALVLVGSDVWWREIRRSLTAWDATKHPDPA